MPRGRGIPSYRHHKSSGQAIVTLTDELGHRRDVYLGTYGTAASRKEYGRVISEWETAGRCLPPDSAVDTAKSELSINELCLAYWRHAERYYIKDGKRTSETYVIKQALRHLRQLYGHTLARDFGPLALKAVRQKLIEHRIVRMVKVRDPETGKLREEEELLQNGLTRRTINKLVGRIKRMFAWAVQEELLAVAIHAALMRVEGLRKGKGQGREKPRIKPVAVAVVEETLPHLSPVIQAMVQVQLLTGMRPQEVCLMRPVDIDMTPAIWEYRPARYKTEHHHDEGPDQERIVFIGPRAQAILKPLLPLNVASYIFSPHRSEEERNAKRKQERRSPMTPSQAKRLARAKRNHWNDCYDPTAYRRAIRRACEKAGIPRWHPNQLRHAQGTEVRKHFGLEAAQAVLGHAQLGVTQIYAEVDRETALRVVKEIG